MADTIKKEYENVKCSDCKHNQKLELYKNVYQDDSGSWTICEKCNKSYHVEYEIEII